MLSISVLSHIAYQTSHSDPPYLPGILPLGIGVICSYDSYHLFVTKTWATSSIVRRGKVALEAISNQQSAISNQQSAISNQKRYTTINKSTI